jgi:hypothetical protein
MTCWPRLTGSAQTTSAHLQEDTMTTTRTAIGRVPGAGRVMTPRRAEARLAPGGREGPREGDNPAVGPPLAGQAARWQLILDLLDPDKRCGAWSPATVRGRPVVCTRAPHHAREEHANAETGWRWHDETPSPRP